MSMTFIASAITGVGLHVAGHGASHEAWHYWGVAHVLTSLCWLAAVGIHIKRHERWYKALVSKGITRKRLPTLALSLLFLTTVVTGIVLLACIEGANSPWGLLHYKLGLILIVFSLFHAFRRGRRGGWFCFRSVTNRP